MTDVCDTLETIRLRPHMVTSDELHELLVAAGFDLVLERPPLAVYKRGETQLTLRVDSSPFMAAGSVAKAIAAVEEVVDCDEG